MESIKEFVDKVKVYLKAGDGGNGCVSFRREKFVPKGGPDGGDGGDGGDIIIKASSSYNTLTHLAYNPHLRAENGEDGGSSNKKGRRGEDLIVYVPCGTIVKDEEGDVVADLLREGSFFVAAKGGKGGKGNAHFKSSLNQAPTIRELGEKGEEKTLILELFLIADVGLVGFPNAGKSTFLARTTKAKPKIADYPFTTLKPNLGICFYKEKSFVIADIPGLIEGASKGKGLGHEFLRHIERTKILLHLVDPLGYYDIDPIDSVKIIENELKEYSPKLLRKKRLIAVNKADLPQAKDVFERLKKRYKRDVFLISSVTGLGIEKLLDRILKLLTLHKYEPLEESKSVEPTQRIVKVEKGFEVEVKDGIFYVKGKNIERIVSITDLNNEESVKRMYNIFKKIGVVKELKKKGIKEGDTVIINNIEFDWKDDL